MSRDRVVTVTNPRGQIAFDKQTGKFVQIPKTCDPASVSVVEQIAQKTYFEVVSIDEQALEEIDKICKKAYENTAATPVADNVKKNVAKNRAPKVILKGECSGVIKSPKTTKVMDKLSTETTKKKETLPQVRASLKPLIGFFEENGCDIPDASFDKLDDTPFGKLLRFLAKGGITTTEVGNSQVDIIRMIKKWVRELQGFRIGDGVFRISDSDVSVILGLPTKGVTFNLDNKSMSKPTKNPVIMKYFAKHEKVTKKDVFKALLVAIKEKAVEDIAILLIVALMCTFLFVTTCTSISWVLIHHACKLSCLSQYSWSKMVLTFLTTSLNKEANSCAGCTPIIMYWIADKTHLIEKSKGRNIYPSCVQWNLNSLHDKVVKLTDCELQLKMETKVNRMMGAFLEAQKDDPFYNSVEDDPTTPTFNIWGMICKDEMKRREEEAMNNVQTIIDNLEEEIQTQQIENDIEVDEKVVNNLQIAKRTIEDHNEVLWQVLDKIDVDKKLVEAKVQALKDNMKKKISELEKENDSYLLLIGKKEAENEKLRSELTSLRNFVAETSPEDQSNSLILKETQEKTVNLSDDSPLKTLDTFHKTPTTRSRKRQASDILLQNQDDGNMIQSLESVEKAHQVIIDIPSTGKKINPKS